MEWNRVEWNGKGKDQWQKEKDIKGVRKCYRPTGGWAMGVRS